MAIMLKNELKVLIEKMREDIKNRHIDISILAQLKRVITSIGIHDSEFHADEVTLVAVLKQLLGEVSVFRTRNEEMLKQTSICGDVGDGEYDHHGPSENKVRRENNIAFSGVGLLWQDFGHLLISYKYPFLNFESVDRIFQGIDRSLIMGIDSVDNGEYVRSDVEVYNISEIVRDFNLSWDSLDSEKDTFEEAVTMVSGVLERRIRKLVSVEQARTVVETAFNNRTQKELVVLPVGCPWESTLHGLDINEEVLFVVYPNRSGQYSLQTVSTELGGIISRKMLPSSWAAKREDELSAVIGIDDAVFSHSGRWLGIAKSFESIMKMAQLAIENKMD